MACGCMDEFTDVPILRISNIHLSLLMKSDLRVVIRIGISMTAWKALVCRKFPSGHSKRLDFAAGYSRWGSHALLKCFGTYYPNSCRLLDFHMPRWWRSPCCALVCPPKRDVIWGLAFHHHDLYFTQGWQFYSTFIPGPLYKPRIFGHSGYWSMILVPPFEFIQMAAWSSYSPSFPCNILSRQNSLQCHQRDDHCNR